MSKALQADLAIKQHRMTEQQAAEYLGVSPGTLSVWRCTGRYNLPFQKVGRLVRYQLADLDAWLTKRTRTNGATA